LGAVFFLPHEHVVLYFNWYFIWNKRFLSLPKWPICQSNNG